MSRNTWYVITYVIYMIALVVIIISMASFLSSRPAGASHGNVRYTISDCCRSVNRASGTSYKLVALVLQPPVRSVFDTGTSSVEYVLSWPKLPTVAEQAIRVARERLGEYMAQQNVERESVRIRIDWQHTRNALGMAFFFGGIMLLSVIWGSRSRS